ncbi:MAG: DUF2147 domain-containing protein [Sphingomonas sp.]|nr:DUF2147 domain-containing protein [Sphingomonas sp.]
MKQLFTLFALLTASLASAPALAQASVEGRWTNPKRSIVIEVARCGPAWCGTIVAASAKAKANARKGGTQDLVGTRILSGARPVGKGIYKGRGFVPRRNISAPATIRQRGPNVMEVEGCALAGLLCKEQRWTRVS